MHEIEAKLPVGLYDAEWDMVGRGNDPKLYTPLTHTENWIPKVFAAGYLLAVVLTTTMIVLGALGHPLITKTIGP